MEKNYEVRAFYLHWIVYLSVLKPIFGKYSILLSELDSIKEDNLVFIGEKAFNRMENIIVLTESALKLNDIRNMIQRNNRSTVYNPNKEIVISCGKNYSYHSFLRFQSNGQRFQLHKIDFRAQGANRGGISSNFIRTL